MNFDDKDLYDSRNPQLEDWKDVEEPTTLEVLKNNLAEFISEYVDTDVIEFRNLPFDEIAICFECIGSESAGNIVGLNDGERVIEFGKFDHSLAEKITPEYLNSFFKILELYL